MRRIFLVLFLLLVACENNSIEPTSQDPQAQEQIEELQRLVEEKNLENKKLVAELERLTLQETSKAELVKELEDRKAEMEMLLADANRHDDQTSFYRGEIELLRMTLNKSFEISHVPPPEILSRQEALTVIQNAVAFVGGVFKYDSLMCSPEETYEGLYLVTEENIRTLDALRKQIRAFYSEELTTQFMNQYVDHAANDLEQPMYIAHQDKLYSVCGGMGKSPLDWEEWDYVLLELIRMHATEDRMTLKLYLPVRTDSEQYTEDRFALSFVEKEIEFVKEDGVWKLNTDIHDIA